jgi:hypothetical protein
MPKLSIALQELRAERGRVQSLVEKLDQAISVIESLNGSGSSQAKPLRVISLASRRKMAQAQRTRWANMRKEAKPTSATAAADKPKRGISKATRQKIAAAQRVRWAKIRAVKKAA